jgi:hypothetical protein
VSTSAVFDWLSTQLSQRSTLEVIQARGTLRLALKDAGLEARTLTKLQAQVVLAKVLPHELGPRGVPNATQLCADLAIALKAMTFAGATTEAAESIFARLGKK